MPSNPLFSVVIPVWNKKPHIARSVGSVLAQTYGDFEILAVDDCSTDGSMAEFGRFSDPRIRLLSHADGKPRGPGGARNVGILAARGEWVSFLDADDEWEAGHLAEMVALMRQFRQSGMLASAFLNAENEQVRKLAPYARKFSHKGRHIVSFETYLGLCTKGFCPVWTSVTSVKKTVLDTAGLFPEGIVNGEDLDLWLRIMSKTDLAWSHRIGATYYGDTVNKLTHINTHNVHDHLPTINGLHASSVSECEKKCLRAYKNMFVLSTLILTIRDNRTPSLRSIAGFDWFSSPLLSLQVLFLFMLPNPAALALMGMRRKVLIFVGLRL